MSKPAIFISYAWGGESESIAEAIEREFSHRNINIIRDKKDLAYKGNIGHFMQQLGLAGYVILIISPKYLRSEHCMFELLQIFKNKDFQNRIFPVVLDDVRINKASDRLELVKFWEHETDRLDKKIRELKDLSNIQGVTDDLNLYSEIRNNIANLTNILSEINTLSISQHIESNFNQLVSLVAKKISEDKNTVGPALMKWHYLVAFLLFTLIASGTVWIINSQNTPKGTEHVSQANNPEVITKAPLRDTLIIKDEDKASNPQLNKTGDIVKKQYFKVELIVPSHLTNGKITVDGKPAIIVNKTLTFITVQVEKKGHGQQHHFEVSNDQSSCATDQVITENDIQILICEL